MATSERVTIGGVEVRPVIEVIEPDSIMIMGHAKRGKSTLAASISEVEGFEKNLFIDLERGSKAFATR